MSKFKQAIFEALTVEYENYIPQITEKHIFSKKFNRKMKKLIRRQKKPYYKLINTAWKRAVCAVTAIIISMTIVTQVEAVRTAFKDFIAYIFEKFSVFQSVNDDKTPEIITDVYMITKIPNGFEIEYEEYTDLINNVIYRKDDEVIIFYQTVTSEYNSIWNTENSDFETMIINGNEAVFFEDNHNYKTIIWYNGEYVISIGSNIDKNSLLNLAHFVQKVE